MHVQTTVCVCNDGRKMSRNYILRFDGASKGNPGPSGAGAVIINNGTILYSCSQSLGISTNNQAEYQGLILGLKMAKQNGIDKIEIEGDSKLVISQVKGIYKINVDLLKKLREEVISLIDGMNIVSIKHIERKYNKDADRLASEAAYI